MRAFLAENDRYPDEVIARLPPTECTVEKIVINAVMAGAPPESLELLVAAIVAIADPDFELYGVNATTASVYPALIVNGPIRQALDIPYSFGCFGGAATKAVAIGRALRLIIRNVAGQVAGETSQTTFGSPGRISGLLAGEWEERSPWAPLAERRAGIKGNAVTAFGTMGTMNILDTTSQAAVHFLEMIGKSLPYVSNNCFSPAMPYGEVMVALNPICAEIVGREMPNIEDVQECLWRFASVPADLLQSLHREQLEGARPGARGRSNLHDARAQGCDRVRRRRHWRAARDRLSYLRQLADPNTGHRRAGSGGGINSATPGRRLPAGMRAFSHTDLL